MPAQATDLGLEPDLEPGEEGDQLDLDQEEPASVKEGLDPEVRALLVFCLRSECFQMHT